MNLFPKLNKPSNHEKKIFCEFEGKTIFNRSMDTINDPLIILAFTNRSGSNYLAELLRSTGAFTGFFEHLNHEAVSNMRMQTQADNFPLHIAEIRKRHRKEGTVFGFKASWFQIMMLYRWRIDQMFNGVKVIHIRRGDLVGQAVSFSIADQTKQWTSYQKKVNQEPIFSFEDIHGRIESICESNQLIEIISNTMAFDYIRIDYENLVDRPWFEMQRVGHWANLDLSKWKPKSAKLKRQFSKINEEFIKEYLETAKENLFPLSEHTLDANGS